MRCSETTYCNEGQSVILPITGTVSGTQGAILPFIFKNGIASFPNLELINVVIRIRYSQN